jgi:hypothetical protein
MIRVATGVLACVVSTGVAIVVVTKAPFCIVLFLRVNSSFLHHVNVYVT